MKRNRVIGKSGDWVIAPALAASLLMTTTALAQKVKPATAKPAVAKAEQAIVLRGGKLLTITHGTIENGVLVMESGKITAVGAADSVKAPGTRASLTSAG